MPTRNIKRTYIGGTTSEARKKYFNYDKELTQIVTNLATSYGISPALVIDRLAHEGLIDRAIINNNLISSGSIVDVFGPSLFSNNNNRTYNYPYGLLGLDTIYDTYSKGITKTKRPINIRKMTTRNESGEIVNSGETKNLYDTLELFTAELASRRNQVKQQYPNLTDTELDSATAARYNATNRYFKQLMDSGEYKSKYPIDVKGVNIPIPTKTDAKYIEDQTYTVDMDSAFRTAPKETFIYDDKSWNPKLFMTDGYIDEPENPIVKHFLNNYAVQNFTQPNKVNFIQEKYKCGGRRKAQLGLDIREGGIAIPIANNMFYINGRKHAAGGVAIGPNNKNGVEVEGGEVVEMIDSKHPSVGRQFKAGGQEASIRVFSSVPFLRGASPAQLVMGGANPNAVFKAQEEFKDRNRINDDGTRYELGGEKIYTPSKTIQRQIQETGRVTIGGSPTIGGLRTYGYIKNLANVRKYSNAATNIFRIGKELIKRGTEKLVDNGKISRNVAQIPRSIYSQFVGRDGQNLPKTISLINNNMEEKRYGGSMIYTINGNVKNGLLSTRPKAEWGKEEKINADTKIGTDGLIYKRDARGEWWTDGTMHPSRNKINIDRNIKQYSTKSATNKKLNKVNVDIPYINDKERKKIGSLYYEQNENGQWVPSSNQSVTTTRESGRPSDFGMTRVGINHPNGEYTYHPLTGEKIDYAVVDTNKTVKSIQTNSSSTPRRGTSKTNNSTKIVKTKTEPAYINYTPNKVNLAVKADDPTSRTLAKVNTSSTGGGTQSKDGRWVGQYKLTNVGDWIGLGSNLAGSVASYFMTKSAIDKMPEPLKPIMAQPVKLKTKYNIEPQLTNVRETEQMNRASVRRNTQSSNTSLAREQRLMNEARGAKNTLYGQKENIETQLINQDRLNRQTVMRDNVKAYNEYLNKLTTAKTVKSQLNVSNINNLISGLTGNVNNILGNIESRKATNNTLRAIAAANPNVDARLIGGFDYYIDPITKKKYNKNQQYVGTIND